MSIEIAGAGKSECDKDCVDHHLTHSGIHLFTAEWCGHCKRMKAQHNTERNDNDSLVTPGIYEHDSAKINADELKVNGYGEIEGYPTIYFVKGNKKKEHRGERDLHSLTEAFNHFNQKSEDSDQSESEQSDSDHSESDQSENSGY